MMSLEKLAQLATVILGLVAVVAAMVATRDVTAPMVLALAVGVVLSPLSDFWEKHGFSAVAGALASLALAVIAMAGMALMLQPLVQQVIDTAPKVWADVQGLILSFRGFAKELADMSSGVSQAVSAAAPDAASVSSAEAGVAMPTVTDALMIAPRVIEQLMIFLGTLFFFLLSRNASYEWLARHLSEPTRRAYTAERLLSAERSVSRYFLTITLVNAVLGVITAVGLKVIGLENAPIWGALAFLLNFVVYLGPAAVSVALVFSGIAAFDGIRVLVPAAFFIGLCTVEGQFITPTLVGRSMVVNPLLVFLILIAGIWIWGPVGGIVAIPLLLWVRVMTTGKSGGVAPAAVAAR